MAYESEQVVLRIVPNSPKTIVKTQDGAELSGANIHRFMDKRRVWRNDAEGKYVELLFDGKCFTFRPGKVIQVGKTIANHLMRSPLLIAGSDTECLTGPM